MPLLAQMEGATFISLSALAITTIWLLVRTQRHLARESGSRPTAPPSVEVTSPKVQLAQRSRELDRWQVEMHELARELTAKLDSKMVVLGHLISDAQRQASRLEALLRETRQAVPSLAATQGALVLEPALQDRTPNSDATAAPAAVQSAGSPAGQSVAPVLATPVLADTGANLSGSARRVDARLSVDADESRKGLGGKRGRPHDEIYALADAGHSSASISQHVGSPIGEVELILGLRQGS